MPSCITPFYVRDKITEKLFPVPCGKCPNCKARRISGWSFRLLMEAKHSESAFFITYTYDTTHVPISKDTGYMSLCKRDLQLYFKRLRKLHSGCSLKYYAVGEYGTKSYRPHYHVILFNARFELIEKPWQLGNVFYGTVTGASVGYCLKYMSKEPRIPQHRNDDRVPEFSHMSNGLGQAYLTNVMHDWHKADMGNRMYCNLLDGRKIAMPRYYKLKIYTDEERKQIGKIQTIAAQIRDAQHEVAMAEQFGDDYSRVKFESDLLSFKNMYKNAELLRDKI